MPTHHKDKTRDATDPKPAGDWYRLLGVDDNGEIFLYWSEKPGEYADFLKPKINSVWGTLVHKNHMLPENRAFIADLEMVRKLEKFEILRPCGLSQKKEYRKWKEGKAF